MKKCTKCLLIKQFDSFTRHKKSRDGFYQRCKLCKAIDDKNYIMNNNYNVIGDIAGNYLTLIALLEQMPKDAELICLGDPVDRGPRSKQVVEFLMNNGRTVNSNHAHMLVDSWYQSATPGAYPAHYGKKVFFWNGGMQTVDSYDPTKTCKHETLHKYIPKEHIKFLENCPMYIQTDKYFFSHAPLFIKNTIEKSAQLGMGFLDEMNPDIVSRSNLLWNRYVPERPHPELNGKISIFGHNSSDCVKVYCSKYPHGIKIETTVAFQGLLNDPAIRVWGICLDTSGGRKLTGLHLPTMTLYEQEYID